MSRSGNELISSIERSREAAVTAAVGQIRRHVAGLTLFSTDELRQAVEATIDDVVQHLSGNANGWEASRRAGRRNATAGVPIEDMLHAYHLCAAVWWGNYTADHSGNYDVAGDASGCGTPSNAPQQRPSPRTEVRSSPGLTRIEAVVIEP
jgi:hypothetical protein